MKRALFTAFAAVLAASTAAGLRAQRGGALPACPADNGGLQLPAGFCALVAADNLGIGRQMAAALVEIARREPSLVEVLAHTLPEVNASTRILEGLGFAHLGTVEDPEDGPVWRWVLRLPGPALT